MELTELWVSLRCKQEMHSEQMSKLPCVSLFQIFSAMFLPNINWLQLGKLSQKIIRVNFLLRRMLSGMKLGLLFFFWKSALIIKFTKCTMQCRPYENPKFNSKTASYTIITCTGL